MKTLASVMSTHQTIKVIQASPQKLEHLVDQFVARFPHLEDMNKALGNCKMITYELAKYLRQRGIKASIYHMKGYEGPKFESPQERWQNKPPEKWSHYVVVAENKIIDCSRRQFDRKCPHPYICPVKEYKEVWNRFHFDRFMNRFLDRFLRARL